MKKFEVGKKYKFRKGYEVQFLTITGDDNTFIVHNVDPSGDAWTLNATWRGTAPHETNGWFVASPKMLNSGDVLEVE